MTATVAAASVTVERYDHQGSVRDWPAMRGQRFSCGGQTVWVSDCGHVDVDFVSLRGPSAESLAAGEEMLAVLTAAVSAARAAHANWADEGGDRS